LLSSQYSFGYLEETLPIIAKDIVPAPVGTAGREDDTRDFARNTSTVRETTRELPENYSHIEQENIGKAYCTRLTTKEIRYII